MAERAIRFGVTDHAGRRAATWKCWTQFGGGKRDVYLACRELQGNVKLSLHESGRWHVGFDSQRFESMFEAGSTPASRFSGTWTRPAPLIEGLTLACRVHIPWYGVTIPVPSLDRNVYWIPWAPHGQSIEVAIFLSEPGAPVSSWPGCRSMNTKLVDSIEVDGGGRVWVVYHSIPLFEPSIPTTSAPKYFKGQGEENLFEDGIRAIAWGQGEDGSILLYDAPISTRTSV